MDEQLEAWVSYSEALAKKEYYERIVQIYETVLFKLGEKE